MSKNSFRMAQINLSPSALNDLKSIFDYISNDSVFYAEKVIDRILGKITMFCTVVGLVF
jgi:plasmid stabilization system protein ParE